MDRFFVNLDRYGNTSAASIPLALDEARRAGRIKSGDAHPARGIWRWLDLRKPP
jgi:3-oxoacyl-[acyl-carrier-protein] synthase III